MKTKHTDDEIVTTTVRFPVQVLDALRELAKQNKRSLNNEIVWVADEYVKQNKEKKELTTPPDV